ncbi:unnamed protein product [Gordionus sp. m RMFG-2023]|uniref:uncharacterized protein LOC135923947 n=1 Tax=Gordionus sp. m RMFG-2023 TaxID=3053472 RepID=UPI0030DE6829
MFSSLRKTITDTLQQGLIPRNEETDKIKIKSSLEILVDNTSDIWSNIHHETTKNSQKATNIDNVLSEILSKCNENDKILTKVINSAESLTEMMNNMNKILSSISGLESLFEDTENSLYLLQDTTDQMDIQENKLNHRLKLAAYREEKRMQLENLQSEMEISYHSQILEKRQNMSEEEKQRRNRLEEVFLSGLPGLFLDNNKKDDRIKIVDIITTNKVPTSRNSIEKHSNNEILPSPSNKTIHSELGMVTSQDLRDLEIPDSLSTSVSLTSSQKNDHETKDPNDFEHLNMTLTDEMVGKTPFSKNNDITELSTDTNNKEADAGFEMMGSLLSEDMSKLNDSTFINLDKTNTAKTISKNDIHEKLANTEKFIKSLEDEISEATND